MQYHIQTLVKHLFDKDSFEQVTAQELQQFTQQYPYAAVGHFLHAKKLQDAGSYNYYEQTGQASLYFNNPLWLRWLLNQKADAPIPVPVEEPQQQPGFRIVVQMPKSVAPVETFARTEANTPVPEVYTDALVAVEEDRMPPVQEPVLPETPVEAVADIPGNNQPAEASQAALENSTLPPVQEEQQAMPEPVAGIVTAGTEENNNNTVAEATAIPEPPAETVVAIAEQAEREAPAEAASAVAIAEHSSLVEESAAITEGEPVTAVALAETNAAVTAAEEIVTPEPVDNQPAGNIAAAHTEEMPAAETGNIPVAGEENNGIAADVAPQQTGPEPQEPVAEPVTETATVIMQPGQEDKVAIDMGEPIFQSYHTIDYFASQGIKLQQEDFKDRLGSRLKSFTEWLRSMKRIVPTEANTSIDDITNQSIQRIAEHSVEEKEIITEAMAEVWIKQGHKEKAIRVYEKLSLLNPAKSPYFAGRIEQLKAL